MFVKHFVRFDTRQELESLIKLYSPDILLLGGDWENGDVVGAEYAKEVRFLPRVGGYSSSAVIKQIEHR